MRPTEKIENLLKNLNDQTRPELDEKILNDCFSKLNTQKSSTPAKGTNIWSIIMQSKMTKPIAAAIIIVAGLFSLTLFDNTVPLAYAVEDTVKAMQEVHNVHGIWIDTKGRRINSWGLMDAETGRISVMRLEYEDGGLYIITKDKTYFEDDGIKGIKEGQYIRCGLVFNDFISATVQRVQLYDEMKIRKLYSNEFERDVIQVDYKNDYVHLETIIDIDTKRPVKFSIPWSKDFTEPLDYTELIEYNVDLPEGFFDYETGPDVMTLGKALDSQYAKDPDYGIAYDDNEDLQAVCQRTATQYLQAKMNGDIDTIKQLHSIYVNRCGSNKIIEKQELQEAYWNGKIVDILGFRPVYEYRPRQIMVPCKVVKEHNGQRKEMFSGIIVYLREHDGQKSAVITGYFPWLSDKQVNNNPN